MKVEVNVPRTWAYVVLIGLLLGSGMFAFVMAYNTNYGTTPQSLPDVSAKVGHSPDEVEVDLSIAADASPTCTGKMTLRDAVRNKCLGGGTQSPPGSPTTTSGGFTNMRVFISNTPSWQIPPNVNKIMVEVWGGGGGGWCGTGKHAGGGGGYGREDFVVTPGTSYNIQVGVGGRAEDSVQGDTSSFSGPGVSISATGGTNGGMNGVVGVGGTSTAEFNIAGRAGSKEINTGSTSGDHYTFGGDAGNGGSGGIHSQIGSIVGTTAEPTAPGGGGAGCQNGKAGRVVVWY